MGVILQLDYSEAFFKQLPIEVYCTPPTHRVAWKSLERRWLRDFTDVVHQHSAPKEKSLAIGHSKKVFADCY